MILTDNGSATVDLVEVDLADSEAAEDSVDSTRTITD
jgi:hypothetical protein